MPEFYTPSAAVPNDIDSRPGYRSFYCCFDKGYTPPPFQIVQDEEEGTVEVQFELTPFTQECRCNIVCTTQALVFGDAGDGDTEQGQFCPADEEFVVPLTDLVFSDEDPLELVFNFEDAQGNTSTLTIKTLVAVVPQAPLLVTKEDGGVLRAEVGVALRSKGFVDLSDTVSQFQVERYVGNPSNRGVFSDWTPASRSRVLWDRPLRAGVEYGYRVRFRSAFDTSPWSEWRAVTA